MIQCSPYGNYKTRKFTDLFNTYEDFQAEFNETIFNSIVSEQSLETIYYLLYAKYGNSHIAGNDENQWKYRLYSLIYMYGPSWEKEVSIQKELRTLNEEDLRTGASQVLDHSYNPSTVIETGPNNPDGEILTTNEQNKSKYKRGKLEAYSNLLSLLKKDVTAEFLNRFNILFIRISQPQEPLLYESED